MKTYGIYLAYPPAVDLRSDGLGRYLAAFLHEAKDHSDIRFIIVCPSWTRASLTALLEEADIPAATFEIIGPEEKPKLLKAYEAYQSYRKRPRGAGRLRRLLRSLKRSGRRIAAHLERMLATTHSTAIMILLAILVLPVLLAGTIAHFVSRAANGIRIVLRKRPGRFETLNKNLKALDRVTSKPQSNPATVRLYRFMETAEASLMRSHINARKEISAWYSPTAFWPHFNLIEAPRLTCVPDVVLADFPVGFASSGTRYAEIFKLVEATIEGGEHFVTYSHETKNRTLVDRYHVRPESVTVVPHGVNRLDNLITVSGFPDNGAASDTFCVNLLNGAFGKAVGAGDTSQFYTGDIKFIFYASQFRPNKNVLSLLRAYEHLLRNRYIGHKLILTGNPRTLPEIEAFIKEHHLQNDVLCLHGLSARELAACYHLADLAVNPSLSEGGCPFTLTEALSVGTPVVMARIAVTEEIVTDPQLQDLMLFDPYDWQDMAARIEWALDNSDMLLEQQLKLYDTLSRRTWRNVVDEHIAILDRISTSAATERRA